jgi:cation diffusion facilitator CzcD-associated flavoprotein CzcO
VALDGRRIGIVGNGSSGVQIMSALAGRAAKLEHYQRTAQWIMPVENGHFTEAQRAAFREPARLEQAMQTETYLAAVERYTHAITDMESEGAREMAALCLANLEESVSDPALREALRPDHAPLCKRLVFSPDYYRAIQHPNSVLVTEGIAHIEERGIRTADGELHELDIIVYATGFHADCFMRPMTIKGRNGADLETLWRDKPVAYLAISMPDFPNLFMLNGPSGPVGNFSLIDIAEHQWGYIEQLMDRIRSGECPAIAPTARAMEDYESRRVQAAKRTVWYRGGCVSWYLDRQGVPASWPWNYSHFVEMMREPRWRDFALRDSGPQRAQI